MGSMSIWHWLIVALVVILLFGRGRISDVMGEVAKGIKSFKHGLADDEAKPAASRGQIAQGQPAESIAPVREEANRP